MTNTDPSPGNPYALRIGVLHEHSGYSDGDPNTRPSDYFTAARTGHNVADAGGDTGVKIDYLISSEHSENEKIPITTAEVCLGAAGLECLNIDQPDHYRKWTETLQQAVAATEMTGLDYTGFTAMRGFEYTNDVWNHLGVYFGRNVVNAKIDGSYLLPDLFWNWIREPAERGGGSDALVVFNHPGGVPNLTPFDDGALLGAVLQLLFQGNWNNYKYVPDVDDRVAGMEVNGGDDLSWYTRAADERLAPRPDRRRGRAPARVVDERGRQDPHAHPRPQPPRLLLGAPERPHDRHRQRPGERLAGPAGDLPADPVLGQRRLRERPRVRRRSGPGW